MHGCARDGKSKAEDSSTALYTSLAVKPEETTWCEMRAMGCQCESERAEQSCKGWQAAHQSDSAVHVLVRFLRHEIGFQLGSRIGPV